MSEDKLRIKMPQLPELDVFNNPERTIRTDTGDALLTYDPNTGAAFIYNTLRGRWSITSPIGFEEFASMCAMAGYSVSDTPDARRWMAANTTLAAPGQLN